MATGDVSDMLARLRSNLPPWFPSQGSAPVLDGALTGIATTLSFVYSLCSYAGLQTRVKSATDAFLDLISFDYFGTRLPRATAESDLSFRARLVKELVRPRVTRSAIIEAVTDASGYVPRFIEAWKPTDVGAYDVPGLSYWDVDTPQNPFRWTSVKAAQPPQSQANNVLGNNASPAYDTWTLAYDESGAYDIFGKPFVGGSLLSPAFFIEVPLPLASPVGNNAVPAYDTWTLAYDESGAYIDLIPSVSGAQEIYDAINATRAAGVTAWVKFVPAQSQPYWDEPGARWDQPGVIWPQ